MISQRLAQYSTVVLRASPQACPHCQHGEDKNIRRRASSHRSPSTRRIASTTTTRMYFAGIIDHPSGVPKMELIVWGSTLAFFIVSSTKLRGQYDRSLNANRKITKPGSTGPPVLAPLSIVGQVFGTSLPLFVYWTTTAYNGLRQPEWLAKHALPPPPEVFGFDGVVVGRMVGLFGLLAGMILGVRSVKAMGDQYLGFGGVSDMISPPALPKTGLRSSRVAQIREKPRLVVHGPFAYVRHPMYSWVF